jgi:hypothetical protein
MVDFYGLPSSGDGAWPGRAGATGKQVEQKASHVETALLNSVVGAMGARFDPRRFVAFVVMHEFEGLLFSDCAAFCQGICRPDVEVQLRRIRDEFETPEDINDSPTTAPSKRVENLVPGYDKPLFGILAALQIGLPSIRGECRHFARWLSALESLAR